MTVSRTYVANEKWAEASRFSRGDLVRYQIVVSATAKVKINARMLVTGPQSRTILDTGGDIEVSPSAGSVYFQSTIPSDAPLGTYTEKATVTFSGQSTVRTSTFSVTASGTWCSCVVYVEKYTGHINTWYAKDSGPALKAMGYQESGTPTGVGDVVVLQPNFHGADGTAGHIALLNSYSIAGNTISVTLRGANQSVGGQYTDNGCNDVSLWSFSYSSNEQGIMYYHR